MAEWLPLNQICTVTQGVTVSRMRRTTGIECRVIQVGDLAALSPNQEFEVETLVSSLSGLKEDDVLLSLRGSPIRAAVVPAEMEEAPFIASSNIAILRPYRDEKSTAPQPINSHYLAGLLGSRYMARMLSGLSASTNMISLNVRTVRELKIPVPSQKVQDALGEAFLAQHRFIVNSRKVAIFQAERLEVELEYRFPIDYA